MTTLTPVVNGTCEHALFLQEVTVITVVAITTLSVGDATLFISVVEAICCPLGMEVTVLSTESPALVDNAVPVQVGQ